MVMIVPIAELYPGQGSQEPGMFNKFLKNPDLDVREAGEEVVEEGLLKLGSDGVDILQVYSEDNVPSDKLNNTTNVQPGLATLSVMYHVNWTCGKTLGWEEYFL